MKIALTGSTGFLGKELLKILNDKKFNVKCYSLRNKEKIKLFLNDVSKVKYNVIINSAASINPITKNDFYINKYLPKNILSSIKDLNSTKFIHISSINVKNPLLNDAYTLSKKFAESSLKKNNVIIIRPSLIIDETYNISNQLFENLNLFGMGICPMIYPGNLYSPVKLNILSKYIVDIISKDFIGEPTYNIQGKESLFLWEIFDNFCKKRNRKAIKINTKFLNFILPKLIKKFFYKNNKLQNFLYIDRKIYKKVIEI